MTEDKRDEDHPAIKAARAIRELHVETIAMMDGGFEFKKDGENVNDQVRAACSEQIMLCDEIIANATDIKNKTLLDVLTPVLHEAKESCEKVLEDAKDPLLPEIGNYDNDTPQA